MTVVVMQKGDLMLALQDTFYMAVIVCDYSFLNQQEATMKFKNEFAPTK